MSAFNHIEPVYNGRDAFINRASHYPSALPGPIGPALLPLVPMGGNPNRFVKATSTFAGRQSVRLGYAGEEIQAAEKKLPQLRDYV